MSSSSRDQSAGINARCATSAGLARASYAQEISSNRRGLRSIGRMFLVGVWELRRWRPAPHGPPLSPMQGIVGCIRSPCSAPIPGQSAIFVFCRQRLAGDIGRRPRENGRNSVRRPWRASLTDRNCDGFCHPANWGGLPGRTSNLSLVHLHFSHIEPPSDANGDRPERVDLRTSVNRRDRARSGSRVRAPS